MVQACHAVAEYVRYFNHKDWDGTLVLHGVKDREELDRWENLLLENCIEVATFCEPDMCDEPTALAFVDNGWHVKNLPLL